MVCQLRRRGPSKDCARGAVAREYAAGKGPDGGTGCGSHLPEAARTELFWRDLEGRRRSYTFIRKVVRSRKNHRGVIRGQPVVVWPIARQRTVVLRSGRCAVPAWGRGRSERRIFADRSANGKAQ